MAADEQWEQLPQSAAAAAQVPARSVRAADVRQLRDRGFSLRNIERKLRELGTVITCPSSGKPGRATSPWPPTPVTASTRSRLAERWLREPVTGAANEAQLRRGVQLQQVRCLNHLGRAQEASAVERTIAAP